MLTEFFTQSEIFITGGSGVVGKATIEKLLRSCDVKNIYILLRTKKGKNAESRFDDLKNSRIFNVLKEQKPNELEKLVVIPGDVTADGLGISPQHRALMKNVSIFINSAATTRFDEPLRRAISVNVKSTLEALKLAEKLPNLQLFLHVSTLFCNPHVAYLEPKVYPGVFDWKVAMKILDLTEEETDLVLASITDKITTDFPNTYVFTKYLAEQLANDYRSKLPVAIFRPSIILAALEEPEIGYTETITGVMGMFVVWGTGFMQVMLGNKKAILDFMPLDTAIKIMLLYVVKIGSLKKKTFDDEIPICLCSSRGVLSTNFGQIRHLAANLFHEFPFEKSLWIPNVTLTRCKFIFWVYFVFLQLVPASIFDAVLRLIGKKPFMMLIQRRILTMSNALGFFLNTEFPSEGTTNVDEIMRISEGTALDTNAPRRLCRSEEGVQEILSSIVKGSRKFLLNEDESSLPRCRKILKVKIMMYNILRVYIVYRVGMCIFSRIFN